MWLPPPVDSVKVNTDAALQMDPANSSIGFSIRSHDGSLLLAVSQSLHFSSVVVGVALALRRGLLATVQAGYKILETDCKEIITLYAASSPTGDFVVWSILGIGVLQVCS
ncbi:hypothetical protein NE237_028703 [Protea cynaroides]|uniref:RNase H type-1 domain-containing protein n=1 Tax=Protea cynaroides TaxID=273540 RepID=A0A9Q0JU34_9MAGN|nr:hypothetical protein NE237_028703 [Protea cynaroides]